MVKDCNSYKYGIKQVVNSHKGNRRMSLRLLPKWSFLQDEQKFTSKDNSLLGPEDCMSKTQHV